MLNRASILVVDDDADIRHLIGIYLQEAGMQYKEAKSGTEALILLENESFDLIILDFMMDDADGLHVLNFLHAHQIETPIIVLSALTEIKGKIENLGLVADDYVAKPFIPNKLIARVIAILRGSQNPSTIVSLNRIECGPIILNERSRSVEKHKIKYSLSQTECDLLSMFMRHPGQIFTKDEMYTLVWKHDIFDTNKLDTHIQSLRNKIEDDPKSPQHIKTIRGIGYRFEGE
ncbi:response regulator transcription factor [Gracilibacillus thailandensis]|uniref:Response regulator n=1 Tax=Gracilibacillus thailandensis TaxID=563735 RepID=A0A6N7QYC1_9BACI|nr:response regulator transcription factor [Gracilibacillus thailandensis]MRI67163.1 response regulator [Gracilibacillus thailandensis]